MTKCFRADDLDQSFLMPPSLHDWLPENHLARFVADLVGTLNLSAFYSSLEEKDAGTTGRAESNPSCTVIAVAPRELGRAPAAADTARVPLKALPRTLNRRDGRTPWQISIGDQEGPTTRP